MNRHPVASGALSALILQLLTWLTLGVPTYFGYTDVGVVLALLLMLPHTVALGILRHRAHVGATAVGRERRFSSAFLLTSALLLVGIAVLFTRVDLSVLEPNTTFFAGLGYTVLWLAWLLFVGADVAVLLIQSLVWVCCTRKRNRES